MKKKKRNKNLASLLEVLTTSKEPINNRDIDLYFEMITNFFNETKKLIYKGKFLPPDAPDPDSDSLNSKIESDKFKEFLNKEKESLNIDFYGKEPKKKLDAEFTKDPKLKSFLINEPIFIDEGTCSYIAKKINSLSEFDKYVLKFLKSEPVEEGDIVSYFLIDICNFEKTKEKIIPFKQRQLTLLFRALTLPGLDTGKATLGRIKEIWTDFAKEYPDINELIEELIKKFEPQNSFFVSLQESNPPERWQQFFLKMFDKIFPDEREKIKNLSQEPAPAPQNIVRGIFRPGASEPIVIQPGEPGALPNVAGGGGSSEAANVLRQRIGRLPEPPEPPKPPKPGRLGDLRRKLAGRRATVPVAPVQESAKLQESLQLKKLSLKEAMEKEYD